MRLQNPARNLALFLALSLTVFAPTVSAEPDAIAPKYVAENEPAMVAAIDEAKKTMPEFLQVFTHPPKGASDFAIKFPLGGWEHIWVDHLKLKGSNLQGRLSNEPIQKGYLIGQSVTVPISGISDWTWRDSTGFVHGHRTTRVLLKTLDPSEAAQVRSLFGWKD